jgi:hypothetical protein
MNALDGLIAYKMHRAGVLSMAQIANPAVIDANMFKLILAVCLYKVGGSCKSGCSVYMLTGYNMTRRELIKVKP